MRTLFRSLSIVAVIVAAAAFGPQPTAGHSHDPTADALAVPVASVDAVAPASLEYVDLVTTARDSADAILGAVLSPMVSDTPITPRAATVHRQPNAWPSAAFRRSDRPPQSRSI